MRCTVASHLFWRPRWALVYPQWRNDSHFKVDVGKMAAGLFMDKKPLRDLFLFTSTTFYLFNHYISYTRGNPVCLMLPYYK